MEIRVMLFKNWKHVFKHMYQTGLKNLKIVFNGFKRLRVFIDFKIIKFEII